MSLPSPPKAYDYQDQASLRAILERSDNENLKVGRQLIGPGSRRYTLEEKAAQIIDATDWLTQAKKSEVLNRTNGADLSASLQRAFDEIDLGMTLRIEGDWRLQSTVTVGRQFNITSNAGRLIGFFSGATNLVEWRVAAAAITGAGDIRRMRVEGLQGYFATSGAHVFDVENEAPMASNLHMVIDHCGLGGGSEAGVAIRFGGVATQVHTVHDCGIDSGIWLDGCADGVNILHNLMGGPKPAVIVDVAEGAFRTVIERNIIVNRDGAILVYNAAELDILRNQMEQSGTNASTRQATITLEPTTYGIRQVNIEGNNFGGGGNVERSIWADGSGSLFTDQLNIGPGNTFNACNSGVDIVLNSTKARWTNIHPEQRLRGTRGGVTITGSAASANSADLRVIVTDSGLGTMGVPQPASVLSLGNSWTASAGFSFTKAADGTITTTGHIIAGTVTAATLIGTLPAGFRPAEATVLNCANSVDTTVAKLGVATNGQITVLACPVAADVYLPPFIVARHTKYDPGL